MADRANDPRRRNALMGNQGFSAGGNLRAAPGAPHIDESQWLPGDVNPPLWGDGAGHAGHSAPYDESQAAFRRLKDWAVNRYGSHGMMSSRGAGGWMGQMGRVEGRAASDMPVGEVLARAYREGRNDPRMMRDISIVADGFDVPPPWAGMQDSGEGY